MKSLLFLELAFAVVLTGGCVAMLERPLTSLRGWLIASGAGMLLWFIGTQALTADPFWITFLVAAMGFKLVGLVLLLQDRATQSRRANLRAITNEGERNFISAISDLRRCLSGGWDEGDSAEAARKVEAARHKAPARP